MRAVVCKQYGPPEQLVVEEVDDPVPGPGELLVSVAATAVTFPDTLMIENKYQVKPIPPYIPGVEVAGVVAGVGDGVEGWSVGDRVVGGAGTVGGFAELAVIPSYWAHPLPESIGFDIAAGLNYAYGTTLYGLEYRGKLRAGETLLILGAAGALGLAAVELGRVLGARVIAAASSEDKLARCREHGAHDTIDYTTEDLKTRARELTGRKGVDVVFDCVGGDHAEQALRAMAWEGRFLTVGFAAGVPSIPLNLPLLKNCAIVGVFYGPIVAHDPAFCAQIGKQLLDLVVRGDLRPHVDGHYPLERTGEAMRAVIDRKAIGKLVVNP